jgi:hypothetical protein
MDSKKLIKTTMIILFVFLGMAFSAHGAFAGTLKGRDFVRLGKLTTLKGTLILEDDEWTLKSRDSLYEIHLGPSEYREAKGFPLKDGEIATVKGFLFKSEMAVTVIETGGKSIVLTLQR